MLINLRSALMSGKRLPYDAEVEYLESTGTQWIDTGIVSQNNLVYDFDVYEQVLNTQRRFFGFKEGGTWYSPGMNDANWGASWLYVDFASKEARALGNERPVKTFNRYHFDFTDGQASFSFNSTVKWTSRDVGAYDGSRHVFIFDMDSIFTTSDSHGVGRMSFFQIRKNGVLVRDYIPVRKKTVGYLYDRVSGKLFGNAGTGDFVLGPDVIDITWGDGEYYRQNGSIGYNTNLARIDNYIAVTGGHSITWKWGDSVLDTCYLIVYNAQKQRIDFWSPNSATGERTINLNATAAFVRYSIGKNFKNTTFFKDNTTGLYAVRNGKILLP